MNKKQLYERLKKACAEAFEDIYNLLNKEEQTTDFFFMKCGSITDNRMEIKVGSKRVVLSYFISVSMINPYAYIKTEEIAINEQAYGAYKLIDKSALKVKYDMTESCFLDDTGEKIYFPKQYLNKLDKSFDEI